MNALKEWAKASCGSMHGTIVVLKNPIPSHLFIVFIVNGHKYLKVTDFF